MLTNTLLYNKFSDVPTSIHLGFDMGIDNLPSYTCTPPNHNSALSYPQYVMSHINNELAAQHIVILALSQVQG